MLKKEQRLGRRDFSGYFARGKRYQSEYVTLIYTPEPHLRAAAVVSKKVAKKAVDRNTMRRRIYAALERASKAEPPLTGVVIIVVKPLFATLPRLTQQAAVVAIVGLLRKGR